MEILCTFVLFKVRTAQTLKGCACKILPTRYMLQELRKGKELKKRSLFPAFQLDFDFPMITINLFHLPLNPSYVG
jgi:hypothetical protein